MSREIYKSMEAMSGPMVLHIPLGRRRLVYLPLFLVDRCRECNALVISRTRFYGDFEAR